MLNAFRICKGLKNIRLAILGVEMNICLNF